MSLSRPLAGLFILVFLFVLAPGIALAACDIPAGRFVAITGSVDVQPSGVADWSVAKLETRLCEGDTIRVGERSRANVALANDAVLAIDQNTAIRLIDITPVEKETSVLDMLFGAFQSFSRKPKFLKVNTPYLNGSVEGTEFAIRTDDDSTTITMLEGTLIASNAQGEVGVSAGEAANARKGQAPQRRTVVNPRDEVQWALFYPPILSAQAAATSSPALQAAANCVANGNIACALAELKEVPPRQRGADHLLLRSSVLLAVGRVEEARADIDAALEADPNASGALALRSIIDVAQNRNDAALANGQRAVDADPNSSAARIALSYALQANRDIAGARDVLLTAVENNPEDTLAWARLAETHLMLGDRAASRAAAERAVALDPNLCRTQSVLGFAALAEIDTEQAQAAFEQAIVLDSADPMPHLGLGLAKIRQGQLAEGRADLEAAVALDSNNALLRAYLGKAYFEEKRGPLDLTQFEIAKELDPNDPTPWLYDALRLQSENQPIPALRALEESIVRNDNRAVYRSQLLLDKDRAARGANLASIQRDLRFTQLGVNEAAKSLSVDPANASAHRFLSDTYATERRVEISRVSELLQAQLMQDVNINPIQPSAGITNLNVVTLGGPANAGFNEFTQLFERNRAQVVAAGFAGNNDTYGGEAVVSGVYDQLSLSAGAFTYDTDGWRDNNDLEENVQNVFAQWAVTPELNLQAEFRHRDSDAGDLAFNFDPDNFSPSSRVEREQDTIRVGLRYAPTPRSTFLLSYIDGDIEEERFDFEFVDPFTIFTSDFDSETDGYMAEGQYIYSEDGFNVVIGGTYNEADTDIVESFLFEDVDFGPLFGDSSTSEEDVEQTRGYVYSNIETGEDFVWTLGVSYDDYEDKPVSDTSVNPKFGFQWQVAENLRLRAAGFKVVKPSLINNRTIEPTQVAGFNQFFDDASGTESTRYGVGVDLRLMPDLSVGAIASWRELDEPVVLVSGNDFVKEERKERYHKVFAYWTPTDKVAVDGQFVYDRYTSEDGLATQNGDLPEKVTTYSLPLNVSYFDPSGFFASLGGTYVDQSVRRSSSSIKANGDDEFFLVDASIGYRFPKRRGVASIGVKNLFDESFDYQDDSFREFSSDASTGPYFPEMMLMGRLTLSF